MPLSDTFQAAVLKQVEDMREGIVGLVADLVRIPSESHPPHGDEDAVQKYISAFFQKLELEVDVFEPWSVAGITEHPGWWPGLDYTNRPNVVGIWKGVGGGRNLILNGHCDVVPAGPRDAWSRDPYGAQIENGRIFGRGTTDMKAGVAAMVMAVVALQRLGTRCKGNVILQSVVNEEFGGYNGTLSCCVKGYRADAAIVTEPTGLHIAPAAKGGQTYLARVPGRNAHHAFAWEGVSAFENAIILRDALVQWERLRAAELKDFPLFSDKSHFPTPALANTVWFVEAGDRNLMATPGSAELGFWVDVLPGEDREEVLGRFEGHVAAVASADAFLRDHPIRMERALMRPFTGVTAPLNHPIISTLRDMQAVATGAVPDIVGMAAACDQMIFNMYSDTPAIVYGPGNARVAHSPEEYVEIEEVVSATKALALTVADFCGVVETG
jgi:acetylornithine deacetylase